MVLDASVVAKLVLEEADSWRVRELLGGEEELVVPDILFVEIANTLVTKPTAGLADVREGMELVYELEFRVEKVDKKLMTEAAVEAKEKGTAVYDMVYAVLAKKMRTDLLTADQRFAKRCGFSWVKEL